MGFAEEVARRGRRAARPGRAAAGRECEKRTSRLVAYLEGRPPPRFWLSPRSHVPGRSLQSPAEAAALGAPLGAPAGAAQRGHARHRQPADRRLLGDGGDGPAAVPGLLARRQPAGASGAIDGTYRGAAALVQVASGFTSDRWRRHKEVAGLGYGLSALGKVALVAAGNTIGGIGAIVAVDRVGKGIRTAPRDALISLSSAKDEPRHLLRRAPGDGQRRGDAGAADRLRHPARSRRPASTPSSSSAPCSPCSASPSSSSPCRASRGGRRARATPPSLRAAVGAAQGPQLRAAAARRRRALARQRLRRADLRRPAAHDRLRAGRLPAALRDHRDRLHGPGDPGRPARRPGRQGAGPARPATRCSSSSTASC